MELDISLHCAIAKVSGLFEIFEIMTDPLIYLYRYIRVAYLKVYAFSAPNLSHFTFKLVQ